MISCEVSGGLGNQFFRYAFARNLQECRKNQGKNDSLYVNYGAIDKHGYSGDLSDFVLSDHDDFFCRRLLLKFGKWWQILIYALVTKLSALFCVNFKYKILSKVGIVISENPDNEQLYYPNSNLNNIFTIGSFENEKYFHQIKDILKQEFVPRHDLLKKNSDIIKKIQKSNSICLAVRRGDFMKDEFKKTFYVCDLEYFRAAVEYMKKQIVHPIFFVFSNDIEWVRQNLEIEGDVYYESGDDPVWETFRLMYSCKHFIISNSTLHWWAQYVCENNDKIVVSPDRWYNAPGWENHLMLDYFIKIPTGVKNPYIE